jgi:cytochrome c
LDALRHANDAARAQGHLIKVSDAVGASVAAAPSFDRAQALHGKRLYASQCAKCHGADMQGITAPALSGAAFAPASNAHLTIGGVYAYMATNMPADRPGKLKDQEYADIMAFLLNANGYAPGGGKMTADSVKTSTAPLNAGPQSAMHAGTAAVSAK